MSAKTKNELMEEIEKKNEEMRSDLDGDTFYLNEKLREVNQKLVDAGFQTNAMPKKNKSFSDVEIAVIEHFIGKDGPMMEFTEMQAVMAMQFEIYKQMMRPTYVITTNNYSEGEKMENDILVVGVNMFLKNKEQELVRQYILEQRKTGVIVLPLYCEAIVVPKDVEIKFKGVETDAK